MIVVRAASVNNVLYALGENHSKDKGPKGQEYKADQDFGQGPLSREGGVGPVADFEEAQSRKDKDEDCCQAAQ